MYLNDDFEGGRTTVYSATPGDDTVPGSASDAVVPKAGTCFIMDQRTLHEGPPVLRGVKRALRCDVMYTRARPRGDGGGDGGERKDGGDGDGGGDVDGDGVGVGAGGVGGGAREDDSEQEGDGDGGGVDSAQSDMIMAELVRDLPRAERAQRWFELGNNMEDSGLADQAWGYYSRSFMLDPELEAKLAERGWMPSETMR